MTFLFSLAFAFALALLGGRLMARLRLPRATAYLLVGIVAGRPVMGAFRLSPLINEGPGLEMVVDFTLGLILFGIGRRFLLPRLRRDLARIVATAAAESLTTFVLVFGAVWVVGGEVEIALLLATIAMATAPAATMLVVREYESEGPITDLALLLVGINNLVSIIAFLIALHFTLPAALTDREPALVVSLGLPVAAGLVVGLVVSMWDARIERTAERQLLGIATVAALVGLAEMLHFNPLFACLVAGLVVVNSSPRETALFDALHEIDYPLFVLFFVMAGARLHTGSLIHLGTIGLAYVLARGAGKLIGATLGVKVLHLGGQGRRWLGFALMAQAGVAIGLARTLREEWPAVGLPVEATVLAAVVVFELIGPPMVRTALVRGGEVKLMTLLVKRAPIGLFESAHQVVHHFRSAIGLPEWKRLGSQHDIPVSQLMRKNVETIRTRAMFDEVLHQLESSRYDRLLVTDDAGRLVGTINYNDIRTVVVDESLSKLVTASDLAGPPPATLAPDATVADAMALLEEHGDMTFIPVVDRDDPTRLLGIVSQNDVLGTFRKLA
jgi:Kef-type K+ transport system membrane component KefB/predicted transcriptional regulator